ncbi:putative phospholipase D [Helianthus anomalus]
MSFMINDLQISFGKYQTDEQPWVDTIKSVNDGETVRISTKDWLGELNTQHKRFTGNTDQYLKSLLYSNNLCSSSPYNNFSGKIEIKYYMVPDFNSTGPAISNGLSTGYKYPGYTRVNHGKYAVSDKRAHIGTSNLMWDYFYATVGVSFWAYNPTIVL